MKGPINESTHALNGASDSLVDVAILRYMSAVRVTILASTLPDTESRSLKKTSSTWCAITFLPCLHVRHTTHLPEAVQCTIVLRRVDPLHLRLDHVEGIVTQSREAPGGHTAEKVLDVGQVTCSVVAKNCLILVEPHESESLQHLPSSAPNHK